MAHAKDSVLLELATARRRSLQHTVRESSYRYLFTWGDVPNQKLLKLLPEAGFLAKNQLSSQAPEFISRF